MMATCLGLYMLPSLGPISDWKGLSQRFTVRQLTPHRAARSLTVIGLQSFSVIIRGFSLSYNNVRILSDF